MSSDVLMDTDTKPLDPHAWESVLASLDSPNSVRDDCVHACADAWTSGLTASV